MTTKELTLEECKELWARLDYNGNGLLSLAELDKGVIELWPELNHKPAIMRAYKAADKNDDGFVRKNEFRAFMRFIHFYNQLWTHFSELDQDGDRRLDRDEFQKVCGILGIEEENLDALFTELDKNEGGYILFDEFCSHLANKEEE